MEKFEVDPRRVLYSQDSIRAKFRNDEPIEDTIEKLISGEISPSQIKCMRVCILNGKMHSLDNRRLYAFKEAVKRGSRFKTVIVIRSDDYLELQSKMSKSPRNFDWSEIRVRGRTQIKPNLYVNSSPSIYVNSVPTRKSGLHVNSVPTRTPSLYVNSSHTRIQDRPIIYVNSVSTRTQNRHSLYTDSLHTRTQDSSSIYVNSLSNSNYYTGTQGRSNTYVNSLPTRKSIVTGFGDDDYASSTTPKTSKKSGWCVIA
ncbi:hypothetical protein RhiirA1_416261 [Rhizophagus irregularis]|uniref:Uncharacterized protein n=1 Tax=Rhizophagus irregularis TaxID=588596 RepID=A0A2N0S0A0_9GLOM|nr:hypothetical protein RhiirA1_416261 [Rhizophagus irregularis]CAB4476721.1 unnamed protein product [Rhizophagus irregularis]CAB5189062.1 unnamed protein product [Rhizophagus irregularis]CAB5362182.1 unnamed protein product [Rhizophagus irregularis]